MSNIQSEVETISKSISDALTQLRANRISKLSELDQYIKTKLITIPVTPSPVAGTTLLEKVLPEAKRLAEGISALEASSPTVQRGGNIDEEFEQEFDEEFDENSL